MNSARISVVLSLMMLVVACGGGQGSNATSPSTVAAGPGPSSTTTIDSTTTTVPPTTLPSKTMPPTTAAPTTVPATTPPDTTQPGQATGDLQAAIEAFETWVGYLGSGDHDGAWSAMAPTSQAAIGEDLFFGSMVYAMSEGWGSWSAAENISYGLDIDQNGRTLLRVSGTIRPEGMIEDREVAVPIVEIDGRVLVSPFEEFGNVAAAVEEELEGTAPPPVPADSGSGRRVVYSNSAQRVWLVEEDGSVVDSYLVSGKKGVPAPGTYEVYSRSETAFAGHDDITMKFMVRFAHGENLPIGFHAIPNDATGDPLQSEDQLGEYRSAGCVRQSLAHAAALYEWAVEGTPVVVLT